MLLGIEEDLSMSKADEVNPHKLANTQPKALRATQPPMETRPATWEQIGDSFETMGKIGLAMAVGMSAAGLFCRLADQGKVKIPSLSKLLLDKSAEAEVSASKSRVSSSSK